MSLEWVGWVATALFAVSYMFKTPRVLLGFQWIAALLWIAYGFALGAMPVVVANCAVALSASVALVRSRAEVTGPAYLG